MNDIVDALQDVANQLEELNHTLSQVSDGLFYLNLHVGADVSAWTGGTGSSSNVPHSPTGAGGNHGQGVVKWFDSSQGFGFITQTGGTEVFVHSSAIPHLGALYEGQRVVFEYQAGPRGPMVVTLQLA
ncbi:hypothetical protein NODU109028_17410 [Nocardioides dubius]|uniref:CSD domain-containing protein n=1 Tax=Nocardioides dubius TaxID=317019 RepID=A0ABN1TIR6_9ACTN